MKILATGETNTVRKFVELTFANLGIEQEWKGNLLISRITLRVIARF